MICFEQKYEFMSNQYHSIFNIIFVGYLPNFLKFVRQKLSL